MATPPVPSPADERIERLLTSTIFDPEAVLEDCDCYLRSQTDLLKRAHAHYVKFRAHSELFRNAQTASSDIQHDAANAPIDHKREAEFFYNKAAQFYKTFYKTASTAKPLPRSILVDYAVEELIGVEIGRASRREGV